jgi:hypothetical protein
VAEIPQYSQVRQATGRRVERGRTEGVETVSQTVKLRGHDAKHDRDYGELIEETDSTSGAPMEINGGADQKDTEMGHAETRGVEHVDPVEAQQQVRERGMHLHTRISSQIQEKSTSAQEQQGPSADMKMPASLDGSLPSSMPQAILGTGMSLTGSRPIDSVLGNREVIC